MKGIKIHIIKLTAIGISIIYMLTPLHNEIKSLLHTISHSMEMPSIVLSHNHELNVINTFQESSITNHEHKLIDILDYAIDTNNDNEDSEKPSLVDNKIDKHITKQKYKYTNLVSIKYPLIFDNFRRSTKDGFVRKIKVPPKKEEMQS